MKFSLLIIASLAFIQGFSQTTDYFPNNFNKYPIVFVSHEFPDMKEEIRDKKHVKWNNWKIKNFVKHQNKKGAEVDRRSRRNK